MKAGAYMRGLHDGSISPPPPFENPMEAILKTALRAACKSRQTKDDRATIAAALALCLKLERSPYRGIG